MRVRSTYEALANCAPKRTIVFAGREPVVDWRKLGVITTCGVIGGVMFGAVVHAVAGATWATAIAWDVGLTVGVAAGREVYGSLL